MAQGGRRSSVRHQALWLVAGLLVVGAIFLSCVAPLAVAYLVRPTVGPHGYVVDACIGVRKVGHTQVGISWISSQASSAIARPSPYYWRSGIALCSYLPWTPLWREQGGLTFP
jgi:hypothetical protein